MPLLILSNSLTCSYAATRFSSIKNITLYAFEMKISYGYYKFSLTLQDAVIASISFNLHAALHSLHRTAKLTRLDTTAPQLNS